MIVLSAAQVLFIRNISQSSGARDPRAAGNLSGASSGGCAFVMFAMAPSGTAPRAAAQASEASVDGCWLIAAAAVCIVSASATDVLLALQMTAGSIVLRAQVEG